MHQEEPQTQTLYSCALCQTSVASLSYSQDGQIFCCMGCQAVYQILASQNALGNVKENPLFQQAVQSGLISNPALQDKIPISSSATDVKKLFFEISNMWCPSCARVIKLILERENGVVNCSIDYMTDLASVEFDQKKTSKEAIWNRIHRLGYHPVAFEEEGASKISRSLKLRFGIALFFTLNVMMFSYPVYVSYFDSDPVHYAPLFSWLSLVASLPVMTYCGWPIWQRFYNSLSVGMVGMETLVVIGVLTAFGQSIYGLVDGSLNIYFDTLTVIILFILLGKIIETKAKFSVKETLFRIFRTLPKRGRKRFEDRSERFVSLKEILLNDLVVVLTGEKIVLDGLVVEGEGSCDESLLTGEARPIFKNSGSTVLSGSILVQGHLVIKVTRKSEQTALFRIVEMIEGDVSQKAPYRRAADEIVKWFVPCVALLALITALFCLFFNYQDGLHSSSQTAFLRFLSVLLISCPCAIGIAAPLSESYLLKAFAKIGVIIRNRGCLQFLGRETVFVFDKTGTVTDGKFTVLSGLEALSYHEKQILKGMVYRSNHPIAIALNQTLLCVPADLDKVEERIGKGLVGQKGQERYLLGSKLFLEEEKCEIKNQTTKENSVVYFVKNQSYLTRIELGDRIRPEARELMHSLGSIRTLLVSGDGPLAVKKAARECGFKEWSAECQPWQKRELISKLKEDKKAVVAVLGDGINDAPALTLAHIGMAVVNATDLSIQVSDILLTSDRLTLIGSIRDLANRARRIGKQNLFWAFFYNIIGIGLAIFGLLTPLFAAFAMMLSSFIVLINSQRIIRN